MTPYPLSQTLMFIIGIVIILEKTVKTNDL